MDGGVVVTLYYDTEHNLMADEDGFLVYNIYDYITPSMLFLFLKKKETMIFEIRSRCFIELVYPEEEDEEELPFL